MQPAVARAVHGIGIGAAVQEQLHHGDAVGTDGITQGSDALVVLAAEAFPQLCWLVGLREKLQETPIFHGKIDGFL